MSVYLQAPISPLRRYIHRRPAVGGLVEHDLGRRAAIGGGQVLTRVPGVARANRA